VGRGPAEKFAENLHPKLGVQHKYNNANLKTVGCGGVWAAKKQICPTPPNQVVIKEAEGERFFCSEAEAVAAGWRASKE
jgi:hypothetical protein